MGRQQPIVCLFIQPCIILPKDVLYAGDFYCSWNVEALKFTSISILFKGLRVNLLGTMSIQLTLAKSTATGRSVSRFSIMSIFV